MYSTNNSMIDGLFSSGIIRSDEVATVMKTVDRALYVPGSEVASAYHDAPIKIGLGQTISAPHMHAHVLEALLPALKYKNSLKILDVGCGSGYLTACLARLALLLLQGHDRPKLNVVGIDNMRPLVSFSKYNMYKEDRDLLRNLYVDLVSGDGWDGAPAYAPFDVIHVGAAAEGIPRKLVEQLAPGGRMVIPIGPGGGVQKLIVADKDLKNKITWTSRLNVRFVPLVKKKNTPGIYVQRLQ